MFRHEAMPRLSPRVLLRFRLSSPSATARGKSPCTRARIPAPLSAFTRAELSIPRSEEHTSELQSRFDLVCRLLLEKSKRWRSCHSCALRRFDQTRQL